MTSGSFYTVSGTAIRVGLVFAPEFIKGTPHAGTSAKKGNGTRAVVYSIDKSGTTAHIWNAVGQRGKINYIDGQIGAGGANNFKYFPYIQYG
jgi:Papain fold toxin 1, glutamine deamidase